MAKTARQDRKSTNAITVEGVLAIAKDPADATRLAIDLFAFTAHRTQRVLAARAGLPEPPAPKPVSKCVRALKRGLKAKAGAVIELFDATERARLTKIAPAFSRWLDRADSEVTEEAVGLMVREPEDIVAWIREHFDEIEARFAS
jgi:hypothetical protein